MADDALPLLPGTREELFPVPPQCVPPLNLLSRGEWGLLAEPYIRLQRQYVKAAVAASLEQGASSSLHQGFHLASLIDTVSPQLLRLLLQVQQPSQFRSSASESGATVVSVGNGPNDLVGELYCGCSLAEMLNKQRTSTANDLERLPATLASDPDARLVNQWLGLKSFQRSDASKQFHPSEVRPAVFCRLAVHSVLALHVTADEKAHPWHCGKGIPAGSAVVPVELFRKGASVPPTAEKSAYAYLDVYNFCRDRLRAVWQDLTVQHCPSHKGSIESLEISYRFLLMSEALLVSEPGFDQLQNANLMATCLDKLMTGYHAAETASTPQGLNDGENALWNIVVYESPHQAEFWAYRILATLGLCVGNSNAWLDVYRKLPIHTRSSRIVKFALEVHKAFRANNCCRYFKLLRNSPFLASVLIERYATIARLRWLQTTFSTVGRLQQQIPFSTFMCHLGFDGEDKEDAARFAKTYGLLDDTDPSLFLETPVWGLAAPSLATTSTTNAPVLSLSNLVVDFSDLNPKRRAKFRARYPRLLRQRYAAEVASRQVLLDPDFHTVLSLGSSDLERATVKVVVSANAQSPSSMRRPLYDSPLFAGGSPVAKATATGRKNASYSHKKAPRLPNPFIGSKPSSQVSLNQHVPSSPPHVGPCLSPSAVDYVLARSPHPVRPETAPFNGSADQTHSPISTAALSPPPVETVLSTVQTTGFSELSTPFGLPVSAAQEDLIVPPAVLRPAGAAADGEPRQGLGRRPEQQQFGLEESTFKPPSSSQQQQQKLGTFFLSSSASPPSPDRHQQQLLTAEGSVTTGPPAAAAAVTDPRAPGKRRHEEAANTTDSINRERSGRDKRRVWSSSSSAVPSPAPSKLAKTFPTSPTMTTTTTALTGRLRPTINPLERQLITQTKGLTSATALKFVSSRYTGIRKAIIAALLEVHWDLLLLSADAVTKPLSPDALDVARRRTSLSADAGPEQLGTPPIGRRLTDADAIFTAAEDFDAPENSCSGGHTPSYTPSFSYTRSGAPMEEHSSPRPLAGTSCQKYWFYHSPSQLRCKNDDLIKVFLQDTCNTGDDDTPDPAGSCFSRKCLELTLATFGHPVSASGQEVLLNSLTGEAGSPPFFSLIVEDKAKEVSATSMETADEASATFECKHTVALRTLLPVDKKDTLPPIDSATLRLAPLALSRPTLILFMLSSPVIYLAKQQEAILQASTWHREAVALHALLSQAAASAAGPTTKGASVPPPVVVLFVFDKLSKALLANQQQQRRRKTGTTLEALVHEALKDAWSSCCSSATFPSSAGVLVCPWEWRKEESTASAADLATVSDRSGAVKTFAAIFNIGSIDLTSSFRSADVTVAYISAPRLHHVLTSVSKWTASALIHQVLEGTRTTTAAARSPSGRRLGFSPPVRVNIKRLRSNKYTESTIGVYPKPRADNNISAAETAGNNRLLWKGLLSSSAGDEGHGTGSHDAWSAKESVQESPLIYARFLTVGWHTKKLSSLALTVVSLWKLAVAESNGHQLPCHRALLGLLPKCITTFLSSSLWLLHHDSYSTPNSAVTRTIHHLSDIEDTFSALLAQSTDVSFPSPMVFDSAVDLAASIRDSLRKLLKQALALLQLPLALPITVPAALWMSKPGLYGGGIAAPTVFSPACLGAWNALLAAERSKRSAKFQCALSNVHTTEALSPSSANSANQQQQHAVTAAARLSGSFLDPLLDQSQVAVNEETPPVPRWPTPAAKSHQLEAAAAHPVSLASATTAADSVGAAQRLSHPAEDPQTAARLERLRGKLLKALEAAKTAAAYPVC